MATSDKVEHGYSTTEDVDAAPANINSVLVNPFIGMRQEKMDELIEAFIVLTKIEDIYHEVIQKGAYLAQDSEAFQGPRPDNLHLKPEELEALKHEDPKTGNKWNQPWILYALVGMYSTNSLRVLEHALCLCLEVLPASSIIKYLARADSTDSEIGCCSLGAAVQGMDETAVNGAQLVSFLARATEYLSQCPESWAFDSPLLVGVVLRRADAEEKVC